MRLVWICFALLLSLHSYAFGTCVFDSDFGFLLNCNFKKSSLFRVRNLGGVKAHFGLGFSVGDELGLPESLGNLEGNKRRSLSDRDSLAASNSIGVLPASKLPTFQQNRPVALVPKLAQPSPAAAMAPVTSVLYTHSNAVAMKVDTTSTATAVPVFRPIPSTVDSTASAQSTFNRKIMMSASPQIQNLTFAPGQPFRSQSNTIQRIAKPAAGFAGTVSTVSQVPAFQAMPASVSRIATVRSDTTKPVKREDVRMVPQQQLPEVDLRGHTVEELARVANVSVETIQNAIRVRQHQMLLQQQQQQLRGAAAPTRGPTRPTTTSTSTTTTTTTTTTTPAPTTPKYTMAGGNKVMNAPKEYYPVGYDKNFDDNFVSKVDLPPTSFHCGDQKHFPGLYADTDLGCMVFHVCALTDDGLIMKSFLCPESTLFDQTVLKCNWWFYVDCKSSRNLYDSNLPVSKSYQLMKALTFFSKYKNSPTDGQSSGGSGGNSGGIDVEALQNSVSRNDETST